MIKGLPYFAKGEVVKGFGRGSKELGIPTANYPEDVVNDFPKDFQTGVYFGFAALEGDCVHKMVMNIGWNPFYGNTKKSAETYVMHKYENDFYGKILKIAILGYIRPEKNFNGLQELIAAIENDIKVAEEKLDEPQHTKFKTNAFFANETR